ncbi:hypothetical protein SLS64_009406 [Diaporthe eres]|uniref:SET domain-containing protein n=1 Tax=Diaporthe eres TaxID=83184 RepID=A0ABR1P3F1_DIAER
MKSPAGNLSLAETPPQDDFEWDEQDSSERLDDYLGGISAGAQNTDLVPDGMASLPVSEKEAGYLGVASGAALLRIMEPKKIRRNSRSRTHRTSSSSFTALGLCSAPDPNKHIGDAMIDAYFRRYHLSYPIIHEATFRAQYAEVIPQPHGKCWQILAYTIAAIGVYTSSDTASNNLDLDLFAHARSMLSFDHLELGNLTLVQALTLISNYQQKRDKPNSGYNYLGLAVRMATGLGLHKEFTGWKISPLQMEIRRRVWWSLCVFDDLTANSKSYPKEREAITPYTSVGLQAKFHIATNRIYSRVISKPFATAEELRNLEDDLLSPWLAKLPEWFREDSVVEPRYALAHAVMQWRYRNFRIIMYRPFVIRMALATGRNGRMINNAPAAEVHAYNQCLADADVTIKSIGKYWMTNEHNRLAAWYAFPLSLAQQSLQDSESQCSLNAAKNTTTTQSASTHDVPQDEEDTSGGWTGPHTCAGDYCVYAHPTFAAGRGIALITTPESAQALANLPVFSELASPAAAAAFTASADINVRSPATEVRHIPGKGRGLAASQTMHRGTQVMAYTPALVLHRNLVDDLGRADQLLLLRDAVSRLPRDTTRAAFWKQLGQTHAEGDDDILDIVMNNSFNLPLLPGSGLGPFIGNFPEVSMYNHDCRPNVAFHLDHGIIHRTTVAAGRKGVAAGEELSISYVDGFRVRAVRRERTMRNWGFECACTQCSLPEALANASDHRLWRLYEVENSLLLSGSGDVTNKQAGGGRKKKEDKASYEARTLDAVSLLLSIYEQERLLESQGSSAYRIAALNYNAFRRAEGAIKYALLALEQFVVEEGANSVGVREMVALLDDPEAHWSWGKRS